MAVNLEQELGEASAKLNDAYTKIDEMVALLVGLVYGGTAPQGKPGHVDLDDAFRNARTFLYNNGWVPKHVVHAEIEVDKD